MNSTKEPRTEMERTSTMASTDSTTAMTTKLDALPDEILLYIAEFTGAHSCYLGYGAVNKRLNQLFNVYSKKLSKSTSYGGYTSFEEIVKKCETELMHQCNSWEIPMIFCQVGIASGAITFNRKDLIEWALEKQSKCILQAICERALKDRKLLIMKRIWDSIEDENSITYMKEECQFTHIAVEKGDLDCLIYLHEQGFACEWINYTEAARGGHLDCLKYLQEQVGFVWYNDICKCAACGGHLDCLMYLHEQGCEWNEGSCSAAASGGHIECLKYLHEHGCEWDCEACSLAARGGHLDCLIYLHEHGCEWDCEACYSAAGEGHLDCLIYLHEQGCNWDRKACNWAASGGHLQCLKYLHEHGCGWDSWTCSSAASFGHLDCLIYLHEQGCELNENACSAAAFAGHIECLQYMRENGLEWNQYNKHLDEKYLGSISQFSIFLVCFIVFLAVFMFK